MRRLRIGGPRLEAAIKCADVESRSEPARKTMGLVLSSRRLKQVVAILLGAAERLLVRQHARARPELLELEAAKNPVALIARPSASAQLISWTVTLGAASIDQDSPAAPLSERLRRSR